MNIVWLCHNRRLHPTARHGAGRSWHPGSRQMSSRGGSRAVRHVEVGTLDDLINHKKVRKRLNDGELITAIAASLRSIAGPDPVSREIEPGYSETIQFAICHPASRRPVSEPC